MNSEVYCKQLDRVSECLKEKRPHLINRKGVVFHQDNACPHVSKMTAKNKGTELGNFGPPAIFTGLGTIQLSFI
jgi:histone-lysine N-methyltransferase SETMAR